MLSSRFQEYARAADDIGCEIVAAFERDELGTKHAATLLLWHHGPGPKWSVNDASVGGPLTDHNGFAKIHDADRRGFMFATLAEAINGFQAQVIRLHPCPFDHPSTH